MKSIESMKRIILSLVLLLTSIYAWAESPYEQWRKKIVEQGRKELARIQSENEINNANGLSSENHYLVIISPAPSYPDGDFIKQIKGKGQGANDEVPYILDQNTLTALDGSLRRMNAESEIDTYLLLVNFIPLEFVNEIPDDASIADFFRGKKTDLVTAIAEPVAKDAGEIVVGITSEVLSKVTKPTLYCGFVNFKVFKNRAEGRSQWVYYPHNSLIDFDTEYKHLLNGFVKNTKNWPADEPAKVLTLMDVIRQGNMEYKRVKGTLANLLTITDPGQMKNLIHELGNSSLGGLNLRQRVHAMKVLSSGSLTDNREIQVLNLMKTAPSSDYKFLLDSLMKTNNFSKQKESLLKCIVGKTDDEHAFWGEDNYLELIKSLGILVKGSSDIDTKTGKFVGDPEVNRKLVWDKSYAFNLNTPRVGTNAWDVELLDNGYLYVKNQYVTNQVCETKTQAKSEISFEVCEAIWSTETEDVIDPFALIGFVNRSDLAILDGVGEKDAKIMLVPAIMLKYAQDKKFNANTAAAFFLTLDVVTILVPMTKVYNLAKITQRIYFALDLAATAGSFANLTVNALNDDPAYANVIAKYNLVTGAINLAALAGGTRLIGNIAGEFVTEVNQPGIKTGLKNLASKGNKDAQELLAMEKELVEEGVASGQSWATSVKQVADNIDDALGAFYTLPRDKILVNIVENAVIANDNNRLLRIFGLDKTLLGKMLERVGRTYSNKFSNIYKGEEIGKFPAYKNIKYLTQSEREAYKVIVKNGELYVGGNLLSTQQRVIFVMDESGNIYAGVQKVGEFHHSSFLSGADVATAGELKFINNTIEISASSGHYTPTIESLEQFVIELTERGVNINDLKINRGY